MGNNQNLLIAKKSEKRENIKIIENFNFKNHNLPQ